MAKRGGQAGRRVKENALAPAPVPAAGRRLHTFPEAADSTPKRPPVRSAATRLAAEVERLERELAATRAKMAELEARADIDPLSELLNRRGFERELARSLAFVKRYDTSAALIYLDLDSFKAINDQHGHAAGDAMLKAVARALTHQVRASDLVGRIGGDEFAVLLWNCGESDAQAKARALERAVAATVVTHGDRHLAVGASAAAVPLRPLDAPAEAIERADRAMYARKAERRGEGYRPV